MALLFMDSFDHYVTADLFEKWTASLGGAATLSVQATAGRRSTNSLRFARTSNGQCTVTKTLTPSGTTAIVGFAYKATAPAFDVQIVSILNGASSQVWLRLDSSLNVSVCRGAVTSPTVLGTASTPLTSGTFIYIELKILLSTTVGTVDLRFNGVTVLSLTGQNTAQTGSAVWTGIGLAQVDGWGLGLSHTCDYDDLYLCDGSGVAPWNGFLGDCRVDAFAPTGAGAVTQWTPLAGANYQNVDDTAPDDDATYNETTVVGNTDTFVTPDAASAGATIRGVQVNLNARKTDAGVCTIAPIVRHGGTNYAGADHAPATTYANLSTVFQTNPGTSAAWVEADFNAAEFGYKRTA